VPKIFPLVVSKNSPKLARLGADPTAAIEYEEIEIVPELVPVTVGKIPVTFTSPVSCKEAAT
jgi:hypothetical protein